MSKKKFWLSVTAILLLCSVTVAGVWAYLTKKTGELKNTFIKGDGLLTGSFTLYEHVATQQNDGSYTIPANAATTASQTYKVTPYEDIEKDPTVSLTGKTSIPAYLYIEVVGTAPTGVSWSVDTSVWEEVSGASPVHTGGKVYSLKSGPLSTANTGTQTWNILTNKKVTVTNASDNMSNATLTCYAYLAQQANATSAAQAWTNAGFTA